MVSAPESGNRFPVRRRWVTALVLLVAALSVGVGLFRSSGERGSLNVAEVSAFEFNTDTPVTLARFTGKPLVINFWASWCTFCIAEMPGFESVHAKLRSDVAFLGVNVQDGTEISAEFAEKTGVTYPHVSDPKAEVFETLAGGIGMPTTLFVSADGEILHSFAGPLTEEQLRSKIAENFGI